MGSICFNYVVLIIMCHRIIFIQVTLPRQMIIYCTNTCLYMSRSSIDLFPFFLEIVFGAQLTQF